MIYKAFAKTGSIPLVMVVGLAADAAPAGYELAGQFEHKAVTAGYKDDFVAHVIFQNLRDIAFRKYGVQDMQATQISYMPSLNFNPVKFYEVKSAIVMDMNVPTDLKFTTAPAAAVVELVWKVRGGEGTPLTLTPSADTKTCSVNGNCYGRYTVEATDVFSKAYWLFQVHVKKANPSQPAVNVPMGAGQANNPE